MAAAAASDSEPHCEWFERCELWPQGPEPRARAPDTTGDRGVLHLTPTGGSLDESYDHSVEECSQTGSAFMPVGYGVNPDHPIH